MKRATVLCLAAACFLSAGAAARASNINWSYQFVSGGNASSAVTLTGTGAGNFHTVAGHTVDVSTPVFSSTVATAEHPQAVNVPFAVDLRITDHSSGLSAFVSFTGALSGNIWGSNNSTLSSTFTSLPTQAVDINHHLYTVKFESFTPPTDGHAGSFTFDVKVQHNPEPSTLLLAAIGVPFFGMTLRRRYRRG